MLLLLKLLLKKVNLIIFYKGTEQGKIFLPISMERSIIKLDSKKVLNKLDRWQNMQGS